MAGARVGLWQGTPGHWQALDGELVAGPRAGNLERRLNWTH